MHRKRRKNNKKVLASIVAVQAAVLAKTGILVPRDELMVLLIEEGLITRAMIRQLEIPDLNRFGSSYTPTEKKYDKSYIPVDVVVNKWPGLAKDDKRVEIENNIDN